MACVKPFVTSSGKAHGCGQCLPCRIRSRRIWTHRMMLELQQHGQATFCTLTYGDEFLPLNSAGSAILSPEHLQKFLKRLRKRTSAAYGSTLRFFAVGEYGTRTERPHYHLILYNFPTCARGQTDLRRKTCCESCSIVSESWGMGGIQLGSVTPESIQYVAGYTLKKMTKADDFRLRGRPPEFSRQSRRPGIGYGAVGEIVRAFTVYGPLPQALRHGNKIMPFGPYLSRKLRDSGVEFAPYEDGLQAVRKAAGFIEVSADQVAAAWSKYGVAGPSLAPVVVGGNRKVLAEALSEAGEAVSAALEAREKLKGKTI